MEDNKNLNGKQVVDNDEEADSKIFPQKLMEILCDEANVEAICWLPHGKAFMIHNRNLFAEKIMPKFFARKAKYSSFTRKLNRWNFVRVSSGPELGAYYHEFFRRDKPQLAAQMFCKNARSKLAMANDAAPLSQQHTTAPTRPSSAAGNTSSQEKPTPVAPVPPVATVATVAPMSSFPCSIMAALQKEGQEGKFGFQAPVLGLSGLQLLERQYNLMQEEHAQRLILQHLVSKQQMAARQKVPRNKRASAA